MASPQLENGYTKIANEVLNQLIVHRIPGQELRVVLAVIRKTYGYGKKKDQISYGQLAKMTDINRPRVIMLVQSLVSKKILGSLNNGTRQPLTLWFNKDYEKWVPSPKKDTSPNNGTNLVPKKVLEPSPNNGTHKRKRKEILQKKYIVEIVSYLNEKSGRDFKPTTKSTQAHIKARLLEGFTAEDFMAVIDSKCEKWLTNPEMSEYVRPATLFGTKFESYLQEARHGKQGSSIPDAGDFLKFVDEKEGD